METKKPLLIALDREIVEGDIVRFNGAADIVRRVVSIGEKFEARFNFSGPITHFTMTLENCPESFLANNGKRALKKQKTVIRYNVNYVACKVYAELSDTQKKRTIIG